MPPNSEQQNNGSGGITNKDNPLGVTVLLENGLNTSGTPKAIGDNRQPDGRFGPGNVANPHGRPRGTVSVTEAIRRKLEEKFPKRECSCMCHSKETDTGKCIECSGFHLAQASFAEKKTYLESLVDVIMDNGLERRDQRALKDIWSYIDGMPKGSMDIGVDREGLAEIGEFLKILANPKK